MPKKILFLTTHNLATNPRLVKEIRLALSSSFKVELICFEFNNWSKEINDRLKKELKEVKMICIPAGRNPLLPWLKAVVAETIYRKLGKLFSLSLPILSQAVNRRSNLILNALKEADAPDWVIGHNPGALYPALLTAQKFNCKAGFDVEDYHPGEGHNRYLQGITKQLMQQVLPNMDYVSFASPLIKEAVKNDFGEEGENWLTILNYFPSYEFIAPVKIEGPLRLVWFSQNIAADRGLEMILLAIKKLSCEVELHLFGNLDKDFSEAELKGIENVILHKPLPQKELHRQLSNYDIGLALEPAKDKNNELAISNKILAYMQAGLYVLASNTPAQQQLIKDRPLHGAIFESTIKQAEIALNELLVKKDEIRYQKQKRYQQMQGKHWDNESELLLEVWMQ